MASNKITQAVSQENTTPSKVINSNAENVLNKYIGKIFDAQKREWVECPVNIKEKLNKFNSPYFQFKKEVIIGKVKHLPLEVMKIETPYLSKEFFDAFNKGLLVQITKEEYNKINDSSK